MNVWLWVVALAAVGVASGLLAGYCLIRAREAGEVDELRASLDELQRALGESLTPILSPVLDRIVAWDKKWRSLR